MSNRSAAEASQARRSIVFACVTSALVAGAGCGDTWVDQVIVSPPMPSTATPDGGSTQAPNDGGSSGSGGRSGNGASNSSDGGPIDVPDPTCGNGVWEMGEQCDDDNRRGGDGCSTNCELEACGDGKRDRFEQCDDGNRRIEDGCDNLCQREPPPVACGNGTKEIGEQCDDANLMPGDGCDAMCRTEACGDTRVSAGETCDPPVEGVCANDCMLLLPNCGDGKVQADEQEQCDDDNDVPGDGCHRCRLECGDGVVKPAFGEQCEPPNSTIGRPCDQHCRWKPVCGDGVFQPGPEQCDASSTIAVPHGFTCVSCALVEVPDPPVVPPDPPLPCTQSNASIIPDSGFDQGSDAWLPGVRVTVSHELVAGALNPGALRMAFAITPGSPPTDTRLELSNATRCVSVTPAHRYEFRALVRAAAPMPTATVAVRAAGFETQDCTGTKQPNLEMTSSARPLVTGWHPYDTTIQAKPTTRTMLIELLLIKPRGEQATVLWDDLRMVSADTDPRCGDCVLDTSAPAEECDDGNRLARDGCNELCKLEACGDGFTSSHEDCDEGALLWSDSPTCTPACRSKTCDGRVGCSETCDACIAENCSAELAATLDLPGRAMAGPRAGTLYSVLAAELRECVHRTGCAGATYVASKSKLGPREGALENCYCGSALDEACYQQDAADGLCRAEVEAALETTSASEVWVRIGGGTFPLAASVGQLLVCEGKTAANSADVKCLDACAGAPATCGDGAIQDRRVAEATTLCSTASNPNACTYFFEECDEGASSATCDDNCFTVACGNGVLQQDEECDDGNTVANDGCSPECQKDFDCGDEIVTAPFEECDVPAASNPALVCTPAQHAANATQCRCDERTCKRVVCGDGVIADAEECEPPGEGACDASCKLPKNPCLECVRKVTPNDACGLYSLYLDGKPPAGYPDFPVPDHFANGCLANGPCYEALNCVLRTQCLDDGVEGGWLPCLCGRDLSLSACTALELPPGPCYADLLRAFEAQFGGPPADLTDLANGIINAEATAAGRFASAAAATQLVNECIGSRKIPKIADQVRLSLCPDPATSCPPESVQQAEMCQVACFPPL